MRRVLGLCALAVLAFSIPIAVPIEASASPACTGGSPAAGTSLSCVPSGAGYREFLIPAGVSSISVTAEGGGGGKNASLSNGGSGARVSTTIPVSRNQVLRIYVGAGGGAGLGGTGNVGGTGFGSGGNGGPFYGEGFGGGYGGGGGGSSAVLIDGVAKIVAGGGGGGGASYGGSASQHGGAGGGDGSCSVGGGGGASGVGGSVSGTGVASAGSDGVAGRGGSGTYGAGGSTSGGGGGGGGFGGGGGGNWRGPYGCINAGGGGAGGSYAVADATFESAGNRGLVGSGTGAGGDGSVLITFIATPAARPNAPTELHFTEISDSSITAYWSAPSEDGGSPITGYSVVVDSGAPVLTQGPTAMFTASQLQPGEVHTFEVSSVNAVGASLAKLAGSQATLDTPPSAIAPDPPTQVTFSAVTSTSVTVNWVAPTQNGGLDVLGYNVQVDGGVRTWTPTTSFTVGDLAPGRSHTFSVYAVNSVGGSLPLTTSTSTLPLQPPSEPRNLAFSGVTDSSITLSWEEPELSGVGVVTRYEVSVDGGAALETADRSYTANGLSAASWHSFAIVAVNSDGASNALIGARSTTMTPEATTEPDPEPDPQPFASPSPTAPSTPSDGVKRPPVVEGVKLPTRVRAPGRTVLVHHALSTADGTPIAARVTVKRSHRSRVLVRHMDAGGIVVIAKNAAPFTVRLLLSSPETSTTSAYSLSKTWRATKRSG